MLHLLHHLTQETPPLALSGPPFWSFVEAPSSAFYTKPHFTYLSIERQEIEENVYIYGTGFIIVKLYKHDF